MTNKEWDFNQPQNGPQDDQQQGYSGQGYAQQPYAAMDQKSKVAAGILGILLGAFGVHNFYLGYTGKGIAQLLITLLSLGLLSWVSGIWGFIEGILILVSQPGDPNWGSDARGVPLRS